MGGPNSIYLVFPKGNGLMEFQNSPPSPIPYSTKHPYIIHLNIATRLLVASPYAGRSAACFNWAGPMEISSFLSEPWFGFGGLAWACRWRQRHPQASGPRASERGFRGSRPEPNERPRPEEMSAPLKKLRLQPGEVKPTSSPCYPRSRFLAVRMVCAGQKYMARCPGKPGVSVEKMAGDPVVVGKDPPIFERAMETRPVVSP